MHVQGDVVMGNTALSATEAGVALCERDFSREIEIPREESTLCSTMYHALSGKKNLEELASASEHRCSLQLGLQYLLHEY